MERGFPEEIFRNRRTTFGAAPLFSLQPIGTETCRSICTTARFFPPFPMSCERAFTDLPVKINVVVKMAERREGEKTVGLQQDAQKDDDGGKFRHF